MRIRFCVSLSCAALLLLCAVTSAQAQNTFLHLESQAGDTVGSGAETTITSPTGSFSITRASNQLWVSVAGPGAGELWSLRFVAPRGDVLSAGAFLNAIKWTNGSLAVPTLQALPAGRTCTALTGRFQVLEIEYGGTGEVVRLAVDFEQHCNDATPALFGALRYNSTISAAAPFGGSYPQFELQVASPANGSISGGAIACGGGETACSTTFGAATVQALTATPDAGYVFTGWTGACSGAPTTTVNVNSIKSCGATFTAEPPDVPRTALAIYSQPGDPIGDGVEEFFTPANSVWSIGAYYGNNEIILQLAGLRGAQRAFWNVSLGAPDGEVLTPGTYAPAANYGVPSLGYVDVWGDGPGCSTRIGRFDVLEAEYGPLGQVIRFAADVEQHCLGQPHGIYVALRYNSTIPSLLPFGDSEPRYEFSMAASGGGTVFGDGIACGTAGSLCSRSFTGPTTLALTAVPDPGHIFAGWTGFCSGEASTTLDVHGVRPCGATFQPVAPSTPRTLIFFDSQDGDWVGAGRTLAFTDDGADISAEYADGYIAIRVKSLRSNWWLDLSAPANGPLAPGVYFAARRYPFTSFNGLDISADSRGCNQLTGRFVIHEVEYGTGSAITRLALDAEQHCEDAAPGVFAAIRINTDRPALPFSGAYPWYELTLTEPTNGRITGGVLNCGSGQSDCWVTFLNPSTVALTATPDPGYIFAGWTADCSGGQITSVNVNMAKACAAIFVPLDPPAPRTLLHVESEPGDFVRQGRNEIFAAPQNSVWSFQNQSDQNGVELGIRSVGVRSESSWRLVFRAPAGAVLQPGTYEGATWYPLRTTNPGLEASADARLCSQLTGRFVVHEIVRNSQTGVVSALAVDFEQRCSTTAAAALVGTLRYNSLVPVPLRNVALHADKTLPVRFGTTVTWTATAHPAFGVEYSFWRQSPGAGWTQVRSYSQDPTYTWTPGISDLGAHALQIWARRIGSPAAYDVWAGMSVTVDTGPVPTVSALTMSPAGPVAGAPVTWTATASGGIAPLQYQFWRLDTGVWTMVRDYATSNSYTWTPSSADAGAHALQVWVRNSGSLAPYDAYRGMDFHVVLPAPVAITGLTANGTFPTPAGQSITWTAAASGGVAPLQYRFWRLDAGVWTIVRDYSTSNTYTWTPLDTDAGAHALQVWVRSAGSSAAYEAWSGMDFTVIGPAPLAVTSLALTSTGPSQAGVTQTWQAIASGGVQPLQYKFWRRDADGWKMVRDYAASASFSWTPTLADVGEHDLQVWVRNAGSTAAFDAWRGISFTIGEPVVTVSLSSTVSSSAPPGATLFFTAQASGGVQPLQYQFWRLDPDGWKVVQAYSTSSEYTWTTSSADIGTHAVQVWVRSAGSTRAYDAWAGMATFVITP